MRGDLPESRQRPDGRFFARFFAGKGGVGKTTCAAAAALAAAEAGRRVLAVSTDPAHSLGDALGRRLGPEPTRIPLAGGAGGALWAAEIAAESALERWLAPRRAGLAAAVERGTYLDAADAAHLLSLTPPGVDEIAAILELPRLAAATGCEEVVVDTAPTAHTLRLVAAPQALTRLAGFLDGLQERDRELAARFGGAPPEAGRADAAVADLAAAAGEVAALLRDPERTGFVWVLLPEALAVAETADGVAALEALGASVREIVVNRLTPSGGHPGTADRLAPSAPSEVRSRGKGCDLCRARRTAELAAVAELRRALPGRPLRFLPAFSQEPRGRAALRRVGRALAAADGGAGLVEEELPPAPGRRPARRRPSAAPPAWADLLAPPGVRLLLFAGKGGVGKTTCAAAAALALAGRAARAGANVPRPILLLSTDPAHSLGDALATPLDDLPRPIPGAPESLSARELDAGRAFAAWRERLGEAADELAGALGIAGGGTPGDASDLTDLAPSGMDELVALAALIDALDDEGDELLVVDTAPTGHTLRLLALPELALAWDHALLSLLLKYREAARPGPLAAELVDLAKSLRRVAALLADPARVRLVAVTRAAELPRRETERLFASLAKLGIAPAALLANALPPSFASRCPRCAPEASAARRELAALRREAAGRCPLLAAPLALPPPRGAEALRDWAGSWRIAQR